MTNQELLAEVIKFHPASIKTISRSHEVVVLDHPTAIIAINYNDYKKTYHLFDATEYKCFDYYTTGLVKDTLNISEPNNIGVLSKKKISDWLFYLDMIHQLLLIKCDARQKAKDEFFASLDDIKVNKFNNDKSGWFEENGIYFEYFDNGTYVETKMRIAHGVNTTVSNFKKLSANNYKPKSND